MAMLKRLRAGVLLLFVSLAASAGVAGAAVGDSKSSDKPAVQSDASAKPDAKAKVKAKRKAKAKPAIDRSGKARKGRASYYSRHLHGRKTASGSIMDLEGNGAASKTLPLGTTATVTNLDNGRSEVVVIEDRGPHVPGRIIDVTPSTAKKLGFKEDGVTRVEVQPVDVPKRSDEAVDEAADTKK